MSRQLNRDAGARCLRCGSSFGHLRGCSLEDLTLQPTQETNIRHNPEDVSAFDVDCLLHEIDRLREEQSKHWVAANEENDRHIQRIQQLEQEIVSLRTMAANLRLESSHE